MTPSRDIDRLLAIMAALRTPKTGCPWELEQNFATIAPYTIEEAYEVADAIERDNLDDLKEELGDVLLQVVFHARMAQEQGAFDFGNVVETLTQKLIRRHPHVFGDEHGNTAEAVKGLWDRIKAEEKAARGVLEKTGALAGAVAWFQTQFAEALHQKRDGLVGTGCAGSSALEFVGSQHPYGVSIGRLVDIGGWRRRRRVDCAGRQ